MGAHTMSAEIDGVFQQPDAMHWTSGVRVVPRGAWRPADWVGSVLEENLGWTGFGLGLDWVGKGPG